MRPEDFDIKQRLESAVSLRVDWLKQAMDAKHKLEAAWPRLRIALRLLPAGSRVGWWIDEPEIIVPITDMAQIAPIIESIQELLSIEFSATEDRASEGQRIFIAKDFPLRLIAEVQDDAPEARCRREVVREEIVPVYKLVCDGEEGAA